MAALSPLALSDRGHGHQSSSIAMATPALQREVDLHSSAIWVEFHQQRDLRMRLPPSASPAPPPPASARQGEKKMWPNTSIITMPSPAIACQPGGVRLQQQPRRWPAAARDADRHHHEEAPQHLRPSAAAAAAAAARPGRGPQRHHHESHAAHPEDGAGEWKNRNRLRMGFPWIVDRLCGASGAAWVSTYNGRLSKISGPQWRHVPTKESPRCLKTRRTSSPRPAAERRTGAPRARAEPAGFPLVGGGGAGGGGAGGGSGGLGSHRKANVGWSVGTARWPW
jgi:hypothetical protein